ncbi:MAG TPA: XRE family transcriptional regulator [Terracidiphilus sp.]|jgi:transcriptional regulator with XRE-family HTH domain|nr:XRE family transcriptional regulator [Terracidiphilus sp.]
MPDQTSFARWSLEPYCIGMKLRALRTRKRLTLARLATETGLSTALLSKLETDRMIPTLPTLATICRVYGVGLSYFFNEPKRHSMAITRKAHMQKKTRAVDSVQRTPLHAATETARLQAETLDFEPDGASFTPGVTGVVCDLIYVIEGKLRIDSGGLHETLEAGDCVYIDSQMPMSWSAAGKEHCRVLAVLPR